MKHFEISVMFGSHFFTYTCMTVYEGIRAIADFYISLGESHFQADEFIEILVDMKNEKKLSFSNNKMIIRYVEGEV